MDEPTGGTDQSTERIIIDNLKAYMERRTLIVMTHRNSLLSLVDRILVIDAGKVVADGQRDSVISALREEGDWESRCLIKTRENWSPSQLERVV